MEYTSPVDHPRHYTPQGAVEALDVIMDALGNRGYSEDESFIVGNILKYILRYHLKNGREDIDKAIYYLNYLRENYTVEGVKDGKVRM